VFDPPPPTTPVVLFSSLCSWSVVVRACVAGCGGWGVRARPGGAGHRAGNLYNRPWAINTVIHSWATVACQIRSPAGPAARSAPAFPARPGNRCCPPWCSRPATHGGRYIAQHKLIVAMSACDIQVPSGASQRQGSECCAPRPHPSPIPHLPVPVSMQSYRTCDRSALQPPLGSMLCFCQLSACTAAAYCRRAEACTRISTAAPMSCWYFHQSFSSWTSLLRDRLASRYCCRGGGRRASSHAFSSWANFPGLRSASRYCCRDGSNRQKIC